MTQPSRADEKERPGAIGGGEWSARDLIGHIDSWEEIALEALEDWRASRRPWIEGHFERGAEGIDELSARAVQEARALALSQVEQRAAEVHRRLLAAIAGMSDAEWEHKAPYPTGRRDVRQPACGPRPS